MSETPLNDGALRAFQVKACRNPAPYSPPASPAPTGLRVLTLGKLLSAFGEALFEASGGRTPTGFDNLRTLSFWGHDEKGGFHLLREALGAGAGAGVKGDGASAVPPLGATGGNARRGDGGALSGARRVDGAGAGLGRRGRAARRPGRVSGIPHAHRRRFGERGGKRRSRSPRAARAHRPENPTRFADRSGKKSAQAPAVGASTAFSTRRFDSRLHSLGGGGWGDPPGSATPRKCGPTFCADSSPQRRRRRPTAWFWEARRAFKSMRMRPENAGKGNNFALSSSMQWIQGAKGDKNPSAALGAAHRIG